MKTYEKVLTMSSPRARIRRGYEGVQFIIAADPQGAKCPEKFKSSDPQVYDRSERQVNPRSFDGSSSSIKDMRIAQRLLNNYFIKEQVIRLSRWHIV